MKKKHEKIMIDDHDEKTCFRCRLYDLWEELKDKNDIRFILWSLSEIAGSLCSQLGPEDTKMFLFSIMSIIHEDMEENQETDEVTKH